jgi:hypothetical protein
VAFIYAAFFCTHGFPGFDDGFILSLSYRIAAGEVPHRDFIYVRPAGSVLLHTVWFLFPANSVFLAARLSYWLWMALIVIFPLMALAKSGLIKASDAFFASATASIGMVAALHNFPPMPWHTVDALLFSSLALSCLIRWIGVSRAWMLFGAGFFAGASALFKQNFLLGSFFVASVVILRLLADEGRLAGAAKRIWPLLLGLLLPSTLYFSYLAYHTALGDFLFQLLSVSKGGAIFSAGIAPYINRNVLLLGLFGGMLGFFAPSSRHWILVVCLALLTTAWIKLFPKNGFSDSYKLFSLLSFFCLGRLLRFRDDSLLSVRNVFVGGVLLIGWETQISWGYIVPILGFGLLYLGVWVSDRRGDQLLKPVVFVGPLALLLTLSAGLQLAMALPYVDQPRVEQTHDLSLLYSAFGPRLMAGSQSFQRVQHLKILHERMRTDYPEKKFIAFPGQPLFYFLSRTRNPSRIDWWHEPEHPGYTESLIEQMRRDDVIVLAELPTSDCALLPEESATWRALKSFKFLAQHGRFCAFRYEKP